MKRCIALFLAFSVMFAVCAVPASAADSYSVSADSVPLSLSRSSLYDVAATSVEYSELSSLFQSYLSTTTSGGRSTVAELLSSIDFILGETSYDLSLTNLLDDIRSNTCTTGIYLNQNGGTTSSTLTNVGIASLVRNGFLGLSVKLENLADAVDGGADYTSVLSQILTAANNINTSLGTTNTRLNTINASVGEVETAVGQVNTSVGQVNTSVGAVETAVDDVVTELQNDLILPAGSYFLPVTGFREESEVPLDIVDITRRGFVGIAQHLRSVAGAAYLDSDGTIAYSEDSMLLSYVLRFGFRGLRSLISGSETDNVYSFTLWDNNNTTSSSSATGLGPLINAQLSGIGENLGHLAFMFASDEDIELKQDSQPVADYVSDELLNPDSTGRIKLSVGNVSNVTGTADDFLGYLETDGQLSDINTVMDDDSTWTWFTSAAAADLDTTSGAAAAALSDSDADDQSAGSHYEWYSAFFRDVLGREYKGG